MDINKSEVLKVYESVSKYYFENISKIKKYEFAYSINHKGDNVSLDELISQIMQNLYNVEFSVYFKFNDVFNSRSELTSTIYNKDHSIYKEIPLSINEFEIKTFLYPQLRFKELIKTIENDRDLFIQFIIETYKSKIDRIINQGGVCMDWLISDNIYIYTTPNLL